MFKKLPYSTRKFVRLEKARIRRQFFDPKKQHELIEELYNKILGKNTETEKVVMVVKETKATKEKNGKKGTKKTAKINKKSNKIKK